MGLLVVPIAALLLTSLWLPTSKGNYNIYRDDDGGYRGIVAQIDANIPEDMSMIQQLQEIFNNGSQDLFKALDSTTYIREVTIVIPPTWSHNDSINASFSLSMDTAHVRVLEPSDDYGDTPRTEQPRGCRLPGDYIHLTPGFLADNGSTFRFKGKHMVKQWGHFRYGLFDEGPLPWQEETYRRNGNGTIQPVRCSVNMNGTLRSSNGSQCITISDCHFTPDFRNSTGEVASIMYSANYDEIVHFCGRFTHDYDAVNEFNRQCQGWNSIEVITHHSDFLPVNGNWSSWSNWSSCSVTCGALGWNVRTRVCDSPPPRFGGLPCPGVSNQSSPCYPPPCPIAFTTHSPTPSTMVSLTPPLFTTTTTMSISTQPPIGRRKRAPNNRRRKRQIISSTPPATLPPTPTPTPPPPPPPTFTIAPTMSATTVSTTTAPPYGPTTVFQPVIFNIVQARYPFRIILIDYSVSMMNAKILQARQVVYDHVLNVLETGSMVALMTFTDKPKLHGTFHLTANLTEREQFVLSKLPMNLRGGLTSIRDALYGALQVFNSSVVKGPKELLIVTDGSDSGPTMNITDVAADFLADNIRVDTLIFGKRHSLDLHILSQMTNGVLYHTPTYPAPDVFNALISTTETSGGNKIFLIECKSYELGIGQFTQETYTVPSYLGYDTKVCVTYDHMVDVVPVSSTNCSAVSANHERDFRAFYIHQVDGCTGTFSFELQAGYGNTHLSSGVILVTSRPHHNSSTPRYTVRTGITSRSLQTREQIKTVVYASVKQGQTPTLGLTVTAEITTVANVTFQPPQLEHTHNITLYDTGNGGDVIKDDGIYSSYFLYEDSSLVVANKYHDVRIHINNGNQTIEGRRRKRDVSGEDIQRVYALGTVTTDFDFPISGDFIPPCRIKDLSVVDFNVVLAELQLEWSAPGDDLDKGQATRYQILLGNRTQLLRTPDDSYVVPAESVTLGSLSASVPFGEKEIIRFSYPQEFMFWTGQYYVGVRALDEAGNVGSISNIVPAFAPQD